MSDVNAIANLTAALKLLLQRSVSKYVPGVKVKVGLPKKQRDGSDPEVYITLFKLDPNAAFQNASLPGRDASGKLLNRTRIGLDLFYLFSCYGEEKEFVDQRLMESIIRTFNDEPIITTSLINLAANSKQVKKNSESELMDQVEQIKLSLKTYSLDETSKLWSSLFQSSYALSVVYQASVVLIDGFEIPEPRSEVKERNIWVERQP